MPAPKSRAILLCEKVIIDHLEGSYSVIGIVDYLVTFRFPSIFGPFKLFLQVTDAVGTFQVSVQIRHTGDDLVLARRDDQTIELADNVEKKTFILDVPPFQLPVEGPYEVLVLADGQMVERQTSFAYQYREDSDA